MKFLSVERKVAIIRKIEKGKKKKNRRSWHVSGIWCRKFYDPNDLEKSEQILLVRLNRRDRK